MFTLVEQRAKSPQGTVAVEIGHWLTLYCINVPFIYTSSVTCPVGGAFNNKSTVMLYIVEYCHAHFQE